MTILALYVHDLSPFLIWPIRWYGLSYLAGFVVAWLLIRRVCRVGVTTLEPAKASDLVFTVALGVVIGGRLGYVAFYEPSLLWTFTSDIPWWGLLALNKGGMASHGGIIGAILAGGLFARKHNQPPRFIWDMMALPTPLGLCLGRIANFINGELWGRPVDADFPLAVLFPGDPAQLPRHPSQLYQAALEGLLLFLVLLWFYRKPRRPGSVGALFLLGYAAMRILGEQFREPDEGIGYQLFDLTRGQWLSVAVIAGGVVFAVYVWKQREAPMGGWMRQPRMDTDGHG